MTYEYDDDFNKVEIKSTQEKRIPKLYLSLGQESTSVLSDYFNSKNAIQIIENDTVFTTIPIFKFLVTNANDNLEFLVNNRVNTLNDFTKASKLNLYIDVAKYVQNPLDIPLNKDQEKLLKTIKIVKLDWATDNRFSLKINIKDVNRNFLGKLLKQ